MENRATVPTRTLANYLLLTPHRVRQLVIEGVLANAKRNGHVLRGRFNLLRSVNSYIRYLRARASHSALNDEYTQLKQRRLKTICEREEMLTSQMRGSLHHASHVEFCVTQFYTASRAGALALPSRVASKLVGRTSVPEIIEILMDEVHGVLTKTAEFKIPRAASDEFLRKEIFGDNGEEPAERERQLREVRAARKEAAKQAS